MQNQKISEMLSINHDQKRYYEVASGGETHEINSEATNLWRRLRKRILGVFDNSTMDKSIDDLHQAWIGDLRGKKVLELGVGEGSPFTEVMASTAREYVALDLSQPRIDTLQQKLPRGDNIRLYAVDFLSDDFTEDQFDFVYAAAVFHHFKHLDSFLEVLEKKLAPGGRVITYDPAQVWWGARIVRAMFRPFQTDADWEHPFSKASMTAIERRFRVLDCQGVMGRSKWACMVGAFSPRLGARMAQKWHDDDLNEMTTPDALRSCLQVSYHIGRRS